MKKDSNNTIRLKYEEKIFDVDFKNNFYKVSVIRDWDTGDFEVVVMKYKNHELVAPTEKQKNAVLEFFDENNCS